MMPNQTRSLAIDFFKALDNVRDELDELNSLQQINKCNKREVLLNEKRVNQVKYQLKQLQIELDRFKILARQATEMNKKKQNQLQELQDEQEKLKMSLKDKKQKCKTCRQQLRRLVGDGPSKQNMGEIGQVGSIENKILYLQAELDENQLKTIENQNLIEQYCFLNNQVKLLEAKQAQDLLQKQRDEKSKILKQLESYMLQMAKKEQDLINTISLFEIQINQLEQNQSQNQWNANQLESFLEGILDDDKRQMKILSDKIKTKKQILDLAQQQLTKVETEDEQFQEKIKSKNKQIGETIKQLKSAKEKLLKVSTPKQNEQIQRQFNRIWERYTTN